MSPEQLEQSPAFTSAFALHLRLRKLGRARGAAIYRRELERSTFRILMVLAEATASMGRAPDQLTSVIVCCTKVRVSVRALQEAGFMDGTELESSLAAVTAMQAQLEEHLAAPRPQPATSNGTQAEDRRQPEPRKPARSRRKTTGPATWRPGIPGLVQAALTTQRRARRERSPDHDRDRRRTKPPHARAG